MVARSDGDKYPRRRGIGVELGRLRRDAGRTEGDAAAFLDCPSGRISRIEQGLAAIRVGETKALLDFYRVAGDRRDGLIAKVRRARDRCWWLPYGDQIDDSFETQLILEADASALRTYQPNLVPGLLQTERYATELIETQADLPLTEVRKQASLRVLRQLVLTRGNPPTLSVVLDEAVLRRPVGSRDVMREQYAVLAESAGTPGVTVQVLPFRAGPHHVLGLGFHIFDFGPEESATVEVELLDRVCFVTESQEVAHYKDAFGRASSQALSVRDSRLLLTEFASGA